MQKIAEGSKVIEIRIGLEDEIKSTKQLSCHTTKIIPHGLLFTDSECNKF